jgi:hypothetical protein
MPLLLLLALVMASLAPINTVEAQELVRFDSDRSSSRLRAKAAKAHRIPYMERVDSSTHRRTYWLEGTLILGGTFALLGGGLAEYACENRDSGGGTSPCWDNVLIGIGGGLGTGASLGALFGGLIRKGPREPGDPLQD